METSEATLHRIEETVQAGKGVVSAEHSILVSMIQEAFARGRSLTFYVPPSVGLTVMHWYWTPRRIREFGMRAVSKEERERIEKLLSVTDMGPWFSNRLECTVCGGVYGAYEFVEQGLKQHGQNWVGVAMELKDTAIIRINPAQNAFCPDCNHVMLGSHNYRMDDDWGKLIYACCSGPDTALF